MAPGDRTHGVRRDDRAPHELEAGEYTVLHAEGKTYVWFADPEGNLGQVHSDTWSITEHEDGTVTVSPSILVSYHEDGAFRQWHGYLECGVWREV